MPKKLVSALLIAVVAIALAACSSSHLSPLDPSTDGSAIGGDATAEGFRVKAEPGSAFSPELEVHTRAEGLTVLLRADSAVELHSAYLQLEYDPARYSPLHVEFGGLLGAADEVLSLAVTHIPGKLPLGITRIGSTAARDVADDGLVASVEFAATPFNDLNRCTVAAPAGSANAVDDLIIVAQTESSAQLRWTEKNNGDYDNNGIVGISDLTPIGLLFGLSVDSAPDVDHARMVDGDGNGVINIGDLTPIGANFGNTVSGYALYIDEAGSLPYYTTGDIVLRNDMQVTNNRRVVYEFEAGTSGPEPAFTVRPVDVANPASPGALSNVAELFDDPGAPQLPSALNADAGPAVGNQRVDLSWTRSAYTLVYDVESYEIERKFGSDPVGEFELIAAVSGAVGSYSDIDPAMQSIPYDYRVRAVDYSGLTSSYSNTASATPYVSVPVVITALTTDKTTHFNGGGEPASNITVTTNVPAQSIAWQASLGTVSGSGTDVSWTPPASSTPQVLTISVTVLADGYSATASLELFVTDEPIKYTRGDNGHFVDFSNVPSLAAEEEPFKPFSSYFDGEHVILFNRWESWCGPCLSEMNFAYQPWELTYGDYGFEYVGNIEAPAPGAVAAFLAEKGWSELQDNHYTKGYNDYTIWKDKYFPEDQYEYPKSILFDRDGNIRLAQIGEVFGPTQQRWQTVLAQLTGGPDPGF